MGFCDNLVLCSIEASEQADVKKRGSRWKEETKRKKDVLNTHKSKTGVELPPKPAFQMKISSKPNSVFSKKSTDAGIIGIGTGEDLIN